MRHLHDIVADPKRSLSYDQPDLYVVVGLSSLAVNWRDCDVSMGELGFGVDLRKLALKSHPGPEEGEGARQDTLVFLCS